MTSIEKYLLEMTRMIILGCSNGSPNGEAIWNKVRHDT